MKSKVKSGGNKGIPKPPEPQLKAPVSRLRQVDYFLCAVLVVAAIFRLAWLGRAELWQDELGFFKYAHTGFTQSQVWRTSWDLIVAIGQMPLAFVIHNLFYRMIEMFTESVTPFTAGLARLPASLFGIAGVWAIYKLSVRVLDETAAKIVTVMSAVFFFPVYYAREAYVYSQIIMLTPLAVLMLLRIREGTGSFRRDGGLAVIFITALLYSHLGALMVVVAMAGVLALFWAVSLKHGDKGSRGYFNAVLVTALSLVLVSPYVLRFVFFNKSHTSGADYSHFIILNDVVAKLFLGEWRPFNIAAWIVLLSGIVSLARPDPRRKDRLYVAIVTVLGLLLLTWATGRSQYLSARYFSPVAPLVLMVMGQGLYQIGLWLGGLIRVSQKSKIAVAWCVAGIPILIHTVMFTPKLLMLTEKSTSFGAVAKWINANLPPGAPFLMESAYEIRWVGESYPTPYNPPAAPFVHGSAPGDIQRLHEKQIEFMTRFPEAPFIESAHHNWNTPEGLWAWPSQNFSRHIILGNPSYIHQLIRWGIYPGLPFEELSEYSYRIDLYYNTWMDRVERAKSENRPVVLAFDGWELSGQQVSQQETRYFRVGRDSQSRIRLVNVTENPVAGRLMLNLALPGPQNMSAPIQFSMGNDMLLRTSAPTAQFIQMEVPVPSLPPGEHIVQWRRAGTEVSGSGIIILDAFWEP